MLIFMPVARYLPGQLVQHRRYGYRGVVVESDSCCQASEDWYQRNRTQPDRSQAWYHVLVDGSESVTYAAEDSLEPDSAGEPIRHPLLERFFGAFESGRYKRNNLPWPK